MTSNERRIRIQVPARAARDLAALLTSAGALEARVEGLGRATEVLARLDPERPAFVEDRVECCLHLVDREGRAVIETARGEGPWEPGWRAIYEGATVGPYHVRPAWVAPRPGLLDVRVDPRGGFGSGQHPTTQVMLLAIARALDGAPAGTRVLDVGAGTGILSIAAVRLGAAATAVEIEATSRAACRRGVEENGLADRIRVVDAPIESLGERFAVVVANLNPRGVHDLAGPLRAALEPGGTLLLGGLHPPEAADLRALYGLGEGRLDVSSDGEWGVLALVSPPAPA